MNNTKCLYAFLSILFVIVVKPVAAKETKQRCFSCETVQHAANLSTIEKHLQRTDSQTIEALDEEAREWFATFQQGGMFFDGWKEISDDVVDKVPSEKKIRTKMIMVALGVRIGCEWSKDNEIRKISTKMLKEWGGQLRDTVDERPDNIPNVIRNIESEVDMLLASQS